MIVVGVVGSSTTFRYTACTVLVYLNDVAPPPPPPPLDSDSDSTPAKKGPAVAHGAISAASLNRQSSSLLSAASLNLQSSSLSPRPPPPPREARAGLFGGGTVFPCANQSSSEVVAPFVEAFRGGKVNAMCVFTRVGDFCWPFVNFA